MVMGGHLAPVLVQGVCRHGHCNTGVERELRTFIIHHKISRYLQGKLQFPALEINNTAVSTLLSHPSLGSLSSVSRTGQAVTNDNPISRNISIIGPIICLMSPPLSLQHSTKTSFLATQNCTGCSVLSAESIAKMPHQSDFATCV